MARFPMRFSRVLRSGSSCPSLTNLDGHRDPGVPRRDFGRVLMSKNFASRTLKHVILCTSSITIRKSLANRYLNEYPTRQSHRTPDLSAIEIFVILTPSDAQKA